MKIVGLDVVVVGGGIVGVCAAYFLQKAGMNVTLIERENLGGVVAGVECAQLGLGAKCDDVAVELPSFGLSLLPSIIGDIGNQFDYEPALEVTYCFNEFEYKELSALVKVRREQGWDALLLSSTDLTQLSDSLPENVYGAAALQGAAKLNTEKFVQALATCIGDRGGRIFEDAEVLKIFISNGVVSGVDTTIGKFHADEVVIAAGSETGQILERLGVAVPIQPANATYSRTAITDAQIFSGLEGSTTFLHLLPGNLPNSLEGIEYQIVQKGSVLGSVVQSADGSISVFSAPSSYVSPNDSDDFRGQDTFDQQLSSLRLPPVVRKIEFEVPTTPDALPYLGRVSGLQGITVAVGHSTNDAAAIGVGKVIANLLASEPNSIDVSVFDVRRHSREFAAAGVGGLNIVQDIFNN